MQPSARKSRFDRSWGYAALGFCLGLAAPVGWLLVRRLFFPIEQSAAGGAALQRALFIYMGGGTAVVLGTFGFFIGKASQQIHDRARRLDELNREVAAQKEEFERRFHNLNNGIKNSQTINAHIQKSTNTSEVLKLSADGLHGILGYDRVNIFLADHARATLKLAASRGSSAEGSDLRLELPLDERAGALYKTIMEKRSFLIDDIRRMPGEFHLKPPCDQFALIRSRAFILCPILVYDQAFGFFAVDNKVSRKGLDETDVETVKLFADQVSAILTKLDLLEAVDSLVRELMGTFRQLQPYREEYDRQDAALRNASISTIAAIRDIAGAADVTREAVDNTRSASAEISVSIQQVAENLNKFSELMANSIASISQISATIHAVQEHAVRSQQMSETVGQKAGAGAGGVQRAMKGLQGIADAVERATEQTRRLADAGDEVGNVTTVLAEITQKTNLLALNAAIIAAQAGENGRAFAVVAQEVSNLSHEAAFSTEAIGRLIAEIQSATSRTVSSIGETRTLVQDGLALGQDLEQALKEILGSTAEAQNMSSEIRRSTQEVARSVEVVQKAIVELGEMSTQISLASQEESQGIRSIVRAIEEIKNMTDDMVAATERQRTNTTEIDRSFARVSAMSKQIFSELEQRRVESLKVVEQLEGFKQVSRI